MSGLQFQPFELESLVEVKMEKSPPPSPTITPPGSPIHTAGAVRQHRSSVTSPSSANNIKGGLRSSNNMPLNPIHTKLIPHSSTPPSSASPSFSFFPSRLRQSLGGGGFLKRHPQQHNHNHNGNIMASGRRMRAIIVTVCCLAFLALVFNMEVSTHMSLDYEVANAGDDNDNAHGTRKNNTSLITELDDHVDQGDDGVVGDAVDDDGDAYDDDAEEEEEVENAYTPVENQTVSNNSTLNNSSTTIIPPDTTEGNRPQSPQSSYNGNSAWFQQAASSSAANSGSSNRNPPITLVEPLSVLMSTNASATFTDRWCDLMNVDDWWPKQIDDNVKNNNRHQTSASSSWMTRAPAVLIPGAKFGGTLELASLLHLHPQISSQQRHAELNFFYNRNFGRKYVHPLTERTKVHAARQRLWAAGAFDVKALQDNANVIALDATPSYLFYSSLLPRRILCVLPWVQLIVVLRSPVDRILAHYQHAVQYQNLRAPLEQWLQVDFKLLETAGFLVANTTSTQQQQQPELSQQEQDVAWYNYLTRTVDGAVGRSIYEVQLRQWFQALRAVGRNPRDSVYIVLAEDLVAQPALQLNQIVQFLKLDNNDSTFNDKALSSTLKSLQQPLPNVSLETRQRLEAFFQPYNQRLRLLLQQYQVETTITTSTSSSGQ